MTPPINLTGIHTPYSPSFINSLNDTALNYVRSQCNTHVCLLSYAQVRYDPSLGGNMFFLLLFAAILVIQVGLGVWHKTWTYLVAMFMGLLLEVIGYHARVQMSHNPWLSNPFLIYIVCLTIAPVFFTANLYVSFMHCLPLYDPSLTLNRLRPKYYIIIFIASDFFSLVLQSAGGGIADTSNTQSTINLGIDTMIAGLAFQVVSLGAFMGLCADFAFRVKNMPSKHRRHPVTATWRMKGFCWSIVVASITILIRSIFRCAELSGGFNGSLANAQVPFMILEGGMMSIALIAMTSFHPGFVMGEVWKDKVGKGGDHARIVSQVDEEGFVYNGGMEGAYELGSSPAKTRSFMPTGGVRK